MTYVILEDRVIRKSRNLRGMLSYARVARVVRVSAAHDPADFERGILTVVYSDGAHCTANFADHGVMLDFVARKIGVTAEIN